MLFCSELYTILKHHLNNYQVILVLVHFLNILSVRFWSRIEFSRTLGFTKILEDRDQSSENSSLLSQLGDRAGGPQQLTGKSLQFRSLWRDVWILTAGQEADVSAQNYLWKIMTCAPFVPFLILHQCLSLANSNLNLWEMAPEQCNSHLLFGDKEEIFKKVWVKRGDIGWK